MNKFTPSKYQARIYDFLQNETGSALIEAVAGSGKTTTIVGGLDLLPVTSQILFLAFNKAIAEELKLRVPAHVHAKTFHSVSFAAWGKFVGRKVTVESNKVRFIIRDICGDETVELYGAFVAKLVGLAKNAGVGILVSDTEAEWFKLIEHYDLSLDSEDANEQKAVQIARDVLAESNSDKFTVDFDDMIYLPLLNNVKFPQFDFVFVDESQDINQVQQGLLKRLLKPEGRLIAVGDSCQAIYGFRGADSNAINRLVESFACQKLPLTVSYRCPKAVVAFAQSYVSHIESAPDSPEGKVETLDEYLAGDFAGGKTAILCRNCAPLIGFAYSLLRRKIPCKVLGREIGEGLVNLVKKFKARNIETLLERLNVYREREVAKFVAKGNEALAESIHDKCECLVFFVDQLPENNRTVAGLVEAISALFSATENNGCVTLCTVHKSKGLEWETVNILDFAKCMPSKWARQEWQKQQERNLIYVACTRAKQTLRFIKTDCWKKD